MELSSKMAKRRETSLKGLFLLRRKSVHTFGAREEPFSVQQNISKIHNDLEPSPIKRNSKLHQLLGSDYTGSLPEAKGSSKLVQLLGGEILETASAPSHSPRSSLRSYDSDHEEYFDEEALEEEEEEPQTEDSTASPVFELDDSDDESSVSTSSSYSEVKPTPILRPNTMTHSFSVQKKFVSSRKQIDVLLELMDLQDQMINA
eukprot:TRINITY_DN1877_c0_g1_i1.p1 TRINITY_DN1877_c0_g1~~TRINITY_DN1877_c0_g1_i1.p1  ORF type:complete len:203 (-),score=75.74 TRINITY_DN1877_c0_g1_i1:241-849(-)